MKKRHVSFGVLCSGLEILILFFSSIDAFGQAWYRVYPTVQAQADGWYRKGIAFPGGGFCWVGREFPEAKVAIGRTDDSGSLIWHQLTDIPGSPIPRDIVVGSDGKITFLTDYPKLYLSQTDPDGNMLWSRSDYLDSLGTGSQLKLMPDNGFLFGGTRADSAGIFRTDPEGNLLWHLLFKEPASSFMVPRWIDMDSSGNLLMAASVVELPSYGVHYSIQKMDTTAQVQWELYLDGYPNYSLFGCQFTPQGDVLIFGDYQGDFFLEKRSAGGDLLWNTILYGNFFQLPSAHSAATTDNGCVIVSRAGNKFASTGLKVTKCSAQGDVEWQKVIPPAQPGQSLMDSYNIVQNPDGGYLIAGSVMVDGQKQPLLIRLNGAGSLISSDLASQFFAYSLYPNPIAIGTNRYLFLQGDPGDRMELADMKGQVVLRKSIDKQQIDLSGIFLVPGVYYYQIWSDNNRTGTGKLLVTGVR